MATGDQADFVGRLKAALPGRWFPVPPDPGTASSSPILDALLAGLGSAWASLFSMLAYVATQTRIATAAGSFLDMISGDFFGLGLPRRNTEADAAFRVRIRQSLLPPANTRAAVTRAVTLLTGHVPVVFEPKKASDTGGYSLITPAPEAPTLSNMVSGSLPQTECLVIATYALATGAESAYGNTSGYIVQAGDILVASSPAPMASAVGWNVYVGLPDAEGIVSVFVRQNSSPIPIGTSWTEPTTGFLTVGPLIPVARPWSGLAYGHAGGYGSLALPFQFFITAYRPHLGGFANVAGYGSSIGAYGDGALGGLASVESPTIQYASGNASAVTDDMIYAAIADAAPVATIGWTRISN